jgi:DNA-directed RNA polymerase subunit omega
MDPHVVFDCQDVVPNRFAMTVAAAARARALTRGAEPRLELPGAGATNLALHEIAGGAFRQDELTLFLPGSASPARLPAPNSKSTELRGDGASSAATAPVSSPQEAVH